MNLYCIYIDRKNEALNPVVIKQGFSLWALVFNLFWAFYHRMWLVAGLVIVTNLIMFSFSGAEDIHIMELIKYVIEIFMFGFFSTELREFYAKKQGMQLDDIIVANSEEEAELKYMMRI